MTRYKDLSGFPYKKNGCDTIIINLHWHGNWGHVEQYLVTILTGIHMSDIMETL